jgi:hypothetical protein
MDGCATPCTTSCQKGYRCDNGHCVSALDGGCHGCYEDGDCAVGKVCNLNNKLCVPAPSGPDARLEMTALDFIFDDMGTPKRSRNLTWSLGFYSSRTPAFDPYGLAPGDCGSERSTLTENAPFPVGPLRDAGPKLTLALTGKQIDFFRSQDEFGYSYSPSSIKVADLVPGAVSWSGSGGADVGAFMANAVVPADFTTTPDVLAGLSASGDVSVTFSPPAASGVGTWLEVSWNELSGNTVAALTRISCRGADGAGTVVLPASLLSGVPAGTDVNLFATRASVVELSASGVKQGRVIFAVQAAGTLKR